MGLPPIHVSASVHVAKFFATGASGLSHLKFGNVDKPLAARLAIRACYALLKSATVQWWDEQKTLPPPT